MTTDQDLDRVLDRWFAQRAVQADGRLIDAVVGPVERQRQLPAWRASWRDTHVNGFIKPAVAIAAVLVIAVIGWNVLPGLSTSFAGPPASPSAPATLSPTPPDPTWWQPQGNCGACAGYLTAGPHTTQQFRPALMFSVPEGWISTYDAVDGVALIPNSNA